VIDPSNTKVIYAGSFGDGVFKSTDGGANWDAVNAGLNVPSALNVDTLALDRANTATLYVGTEAGVFKTTDGGAAWNPAAAGLTRPYVFTLVIDPLNTNIIYAGTNSNVFKSTDGALAGEPGDLIRTTSRKSPQGSSTASAAGPPLGMMQKAAGMFQTPPWRPKTRPTDRRGRCDRYYYRRRHRGQYCKPN
jgi:photosystem II stability/assembly factor-like uncharacterized protein